MASLAIFCDGTWNNKDRTEHDTSVARIFQALEAENRRGVKLLYIEGVGADNQRNFIGKKIDKWRGGALGRGLTKNIREGYKYLCDTYKAGDKIYIFGFSRGAYTARSLAGMIRASGLVQTDADIDEAMTRYRDRDASTGPSTTQSLEFRAEKSPKFYTNKAERDWRSDKGKAPGSPITIAYLGVIETVGTHGIPGVLSQLRLIPGGHGFHDLELSSMVETGRHALGLDERRRLYGHTEWTNLARLNRDAGADARGGTRYRQEWFPGDHGMIGGSGVNRQISNSVLEWIVDGSAVAGLKVNIPSAIRAKLDDHKGPLTNKRGGIIPTGWAKGWRKGPDLNAIDDVHPVALRRAREMPDYRPKSLKMLRFASWEAAADQALSTRIT